MGLSNDWLISAKSRVVTARSERQSSTKAPKRVPFQIQRLFEDADDASFLIGRLQCSLLLVKSKGVISNLLLTTVVVLSRIFLECFAIDIDFHRNSEYNIIELL